MYRAITKADHGDRKIKPHNAGNIDLRKFGVISGIVKLAILPAVKIPVALPFPVREAHRHDRRSQLSHSARGAKADDKGEPVTIIGVGNRVHQQQRDHRQASIDDHGDGRAEHLFDEGSSHEDADQRPNGIDAEQLNRRGIGQPDHELAGTGVPAIG